MIDFQKLEPARRSELLPLLEEAGIRGCGYGFSNLYLWGDQRVAYVDGFLAFFSRFEGPAMYPMPLGNGELKPVLEALMEDAREKGIPFRLTGLNQQDMEALEALFPGTFRSHENRNNADYIYDIQELAELKGRKHQQKRNHVNRFLAAYPDATVEPMKPEKTGEYRVFLERWFCRRQEEEPEEDFQMEKRAIFAALDHFSALGMEGLALYADGRLAALTMGSRLSEDTFDVHFEKADTAFHGAYPAINRAFARYLRGKYPALRWLNREDDMGIPGLRQAKLSYHPHHLIEKYWASLVSEEHDD